MFLTQISSMNFRFFVYLNWSPPRGRKVSIPSLGTLPHVQGLRWLQGPFHGILGPKKAIVDYRSKDTIHDESLTISLIKIGWKNEIQLVFRGGSASKPTQFLDRWKETLFPSAAAELMRNSYWLFQTILQTQGSVWASLVCCWRFEKVTALSRSIYFLDFFQSLAYIWLIIVNICIW